GPSKADQADPLTAKPMRRCWKEEIEAAPDQTFANGMALLVTAWSFSSARKKCTVGEEMYVGPGDSGGGAGRAGSASGRRSPRRRRPSCPLRSDCGRASQRFPTWRP